MSEKYIIYSKYSLKECFQVCLVNFLLLLIAMLSIYFIVTNVTILFNRKTTEDKKKSFFTIYPNNNEKDNKSAILCFNSNKPLSYQYYIKELNNIHNIYNNNINISKNMNILYHFNIEEKDSDFKFNLDHEYCLKNSKNYWGYNQIKPCIIFIYFNNIYSTIQLFSVKNSYEKKVKCILKYLNKTIMFHNFTIYNGICE